MYLHVKASPAFEGDAAKVTWNFDGLDTKLADAKAGDNIAVTGTYQLDDATTIALKARSMSPPPRLRMWPTLLPT